MTGPVFTSLHTIFEVQYTELAIAMDVIADVSGHSVFFTPGSYKQYSELSSKIEETSIPTAMEIIKHS